MKKKFCFFIFTFCMFLVFSFKINSSEHAFVGKHLLGSYYECNNDALINLNKLEETMKEAARATGATVLKNSRHDFDNKGCCLALLLSESHATIHTYPEYNACFIDIFTCGDKCDVKKFDEVLRLYLKPQKVKRDLINRN